MAGVSLTPLTGGRTSAANRSGMAVVDYREAMQQQWSAGRLVGVYLSALLFFALVDLPWITLVANGLYADQLGELLAPEANGVAAAAFYFIYLGGLVYFAIAPALRARSVRVAAVRGGLLGLVSYATWDLTSLAVIRGFPAPLALIDMTWGTFLSAAVSSLTVALWIRLTRAPSAAPGQRPPT